jgi:ubiquinol-cytochrome c reductase cytochrome c subunit
MTPPTDTTTPARRRRWGHGKLRRRAAAVAVLGLALVATGFGAFAFQDSQQTNVATAQDNAALVAKGQDLYNAACITCHGSNLQGVAERGPSLVGVGDAAVYFQVSSGRMPLARQEGQAVRKLPLPQFDPDSEEGRANLDALGAFIQANGGGPETPAQTGAALRGDDPARGGTLFRLNCASCHNFTGVGGALSSGKFAPSLTPPTEEQIYTAMLSGPQNMPKFGDRQLTPDEKQDIIAYVKSVTDGNNSPGGYNIGGVGPTTEGVIAFVVGLASIVGFAMWLGAKN